MVSTFRAARSQVSASASFMPLSERVFRNGGCATAESILSARSSMSQKSALSACFTASAMPDELAACRRVGMNSVLAKPLTFAALRETLREQLG